MIIQALNEYYERMQNHESGVLAPYGFERKSIPVVIEINRNGEVVQIRINNSKKKEDIKQYVIPKAEKRTVGIQSNLLWDNCEYTLDLVCKSKPERVKQQHNAFVERVNQLDCDDEGLDAIKLFLQNLDIEQLKLCEGYDEDFMQTNPNVSFKLSGDTHLICERQSVIEAIKNLTNENAKQGLCLVSGETGEIANLHPSIKNIWGAQSSGANIVSFNAAAFESFNKKQGENSPVSEKVAFQYTEALNYLLKSSQRMQIGDSSTIFWSEKKHLGIEKSTKSIFTISPKDKDNPNKNTEELAAAMDVYRRGREPTPENQQKFYFLGLAPNASRIAIRFWVVDTIQNIANNVIQHFKDIEIHHSKSDDDLLPLFRLLSHLCVEYKTSNLPPNLTGEVVRSILLNQPYPQIFLSLAVRRCKAEQKVSYPRAAIIKACLNRSNRHTTNQSKEIITVSLDKTNKNEAYLLGRWFATLEKIQEESHPGINATIRDKYYSSVSSNPVSVFAILNRLKNHHLSKLENIGRKKYFEKRLSEIIDGLPHQLRHSFNLSEQATFAVGYYHQRQDLFTKKEKSETNNTIEKE